MGKAEIKKKSSPSHSAIWSAIGHSRADINSLKTDVNALKIDVAIVKTDVSWLKNTVKRVDQRLWYVLATVIGMGLLGILAAVV